MTDMNDDFEQEDFQDDMEAERKSSGGFKSALANAWHTKPIFKLVIIMIVVGTAVAGALGAFSSPPAPSASNMVTAPELREAPGTKASPYFIEQNKQANAQRANQALQQGGSALPTPVGNPVDIDDLTNPNKKDPLMEFRAETDRLKQEMKQQQVQQQQQIQGLQQQVVQVQREPEDDSLARAMQAQMRQLMDGWAPRSMKLVAGTGTAGDPSGALVHNAAAKGPVEANDSSVLNPNAKAKKALLAAGTVNYAQLLTEANSDVQAPILAQILSGPLAGGRAIGRFQVMNDYLVMEFNLVTLKGKDYSIDAIALDPNTTLAGLATEVDHRYFTRVLLPAAGAFVSSFGSNMGQTSSTTTVSSDAVLVDRAKSSYKDAAYAGLGAAGAAAAQFFQNQANQTKTLVRVAVGTPLGLFFLASVTPPEEQEAAMQDQSLTGSLAGAYRSLQGGQRGAPGFSVIGNPYSASQTLSVNPVASPNGIVNNTAYNPYTTSYYGNSGVAGVPSYSTGRPYITNVPVSSGAAYYGY